MKKLDDLWEYLFRIPLTQFLSNLICNVMCMLHIHCIGMVKISCVVLEIQGTQIGNIMLSANNILCHAFFMTVCLDDNNNKIMCSILF